MSDEPRRSGRATKGQYTKDRDVDEDAHKKKGKSKASKSKEPQVAEQDEEIIRCICGQYEEEEDTQRDMICCDKCSAWQHNDCMLLPYPPQDAPDQYYCEQCKPGDHKELLAAIAKGEKPWEEVAQKREAAEIEKATRKKRGVKGGRKSASRPSEPLPEANTAHDTAETPSKEAVGREVGSSSVGQKRKHEEQSNGSSTPQETKKPRSIPGSAISSPVETQNGAYPTTQRRKSTVLPSPARQEPRSDLPHGSASSVDELPTQRKSVAMSLIKLFSSEATTAQGQGKYALPEGQTVEGIGARLGLNVEHALYQIFCHDSGDPNDAYKAQVRTILFNVKKNEALRNGLLNGTLTGQNLAKMSPEDMASKEQQLRDAKIKQEQEKQHVIIQEQGPRIRRTHKGEEYVDETQQVAAEPDILSAPVRRRESGLGQDTEEPRRPSGVAKSDGQRPTGERALSINTQAPPQAPKEAERKSSQAFNIQDVWSSVHGSPDVDRPAFPQIPYQSGGQTQKTDQTEADPDIDALLKDEGVESPPYSPKSFDGDKTVVWQGTVNMNPVARFQGSARKAAGADAESLGISWQQLIPDILTIDGRIDPARADSYLCGLRYSSTSDVIVISLAAADTSHDRQQFSNLFKYFKTRNRYGVGASSLNPAIKDIYLIPVEAGSERKPELLQLLDNDQIETPAPQDILLVPFVVKTSELNTTATPKEQSAIAASPIGVATPGTTMVPAAPPAQRNMPTPTPPPASHPVTQNPPPAMHYSPRQQQHQQHQSHAHTSPSQPLPATSQADPGISTGANPATTTTSPEPLKPKLIGHEAVAHILGPSAVAHIPAVQQLLIQAPTVGIPEMEIVAQCLQENAAAGSDLNTLTAMLVDRQKIGRR